MANTTALISNCLLLKNSTSLALVLLLFAQTIFAQGYELLDSIPIERPYKVSRDKQGNLYLVSQNGDVDKYDTQGQLLEHFSPGKPGDITLIEAWNPLKVFLYYGDFQEYMFLDRFLTSTNRFSLDVVSSYVGLATMSADNNIWVIDYSDFSLKKYDVTLGRITIQQPFDLLMAKSSYDIRFMREYQNLLFFSDTTEGILVFDNLGNYLETWPEMGVGYFNFFKNEMYFVKDNEIHLYDIYQNVRRTVKIPRPATFASLAQDRLLLVSDHYLWVCQRKR